jgi:hypothetical protein
VKRGAAITRPALPNHPLDEWFASSNDQIHLKFASKKCAEIEIKD